MYIDNIQELINDGDSYIEYALYGFNMKTSIGENVRGSVKILNNKPFLYGNHEFLYSVFISDDFSKLSLRLKKGLDVCDFQDQINHEVERICMALVMDKSIHTFQPRCEIKKIVTNSKPTLIEDCITISESVSMTCSLESNDFYSEIINGNKDLLDAEQHKYLKYIYDILSCPNLVIQYMALYDFLKSLLPIVGKEKSQKDVVNFFEKNKCKYQICFKPSRRDANKTEDYYTYLRNEIGHPWGLSAEEIKKLGITESLIKGLICVIYDVLSEI